MQSKDLSIGTVLFRNESMNVSKWYDNTIIVRHLKSPIRNSFESHYCPGAFLRNWPSGCITHSSTAEMSPVSYSVMDGLSFLAFLSLLKRSSTELAKKWWTYVQRSKFESVGISHLNFVFSSIDGANERA